MAGKNKRKKTKTNDKTQVYKADTNKKEKKEKKKKKHPKLRLAIKIIIIVGILGVLIAGGILAGFIFGAFGDEFKITKEQLLIKTSNSVVFDINGEVITNLSGEENRKIITLGDMAPYLPVAFVSIEDERFYSHHGVDLKRTIAATVKYALGKSSYGGSTITQQLVKNLTKEDERAWQRKVKEISRAYEVEKLISKDQILELYLNTIFLGDTAYGVEVASNYYFNKTAKDLTLEECAFLAGLNHSPNWYDPFHENADNSDEEDNKQINTRTKVVLAKMKELGKINSQEEYDTAIGKVDTGLPFSKGKITSVVYSYHTDAAIEQILKQFMDNNPEWSREMAKLELYGGNYKIYTTLNPSIQGIMEEEVKKDKYIIKSQKTKDEKTGEYKNSQTAMVVIDHKTGYVVGTVGGSGEKTDAFGLNRATQLPRQPGSAIKPIAIVAPGIEKGKITGASAYDDVSTTWGNWTPKNYDRRQSGLTNLRSAIEVSKNIVFVKMLADIGLEDSMAFLKQVGITTLEDKKEGLALALGGATHGISTLEMAGAYAAIANNGVYITPTFYTKVTDEEGNVVLEPKQETRRVMSEAASYVAKSLVTQPVVGRAGTATFCSISGMDVAAKTGTTDEDFDRWLCGFTPYYSAACWFGYDQKEKVRFGNGNPAGRIWDAIMTGIHRDLEKKRFEKPSGITYATVCRDSGQLATDNCRQDPRGDRTYTEVFVSGTAPSKMCECHVKVKICNDTNKVATEFCNNFTEKIFITRVNSDIETAWKNAADAEYMLPTELCNVHTKPEEKPKPDPKPNENTNTNNTNTNTTNNTNSNNNTNENNGAGNNTIDNSVTNTSNTI